MPADKAASLGTILPQTGRKPESRAAQVWKQMKKHRLSYLFLAPFLICFLLFILIPVFAAAGLAFTSFNTIQRPVFTGWDNLRYLLSEDSLFLKYALPNTIKFAVIVGPGGLALSFVLAWLIAQIPDRYRIWFVLAFYAPSLTGGVVMQIIWTPLLSGDRIGYLNSLLLKLGLIDAPKLWTLDPAYLMNAMIVVTLWSSMGVGFLAILAGILNVDPVLYEAGRLDGIKSRLQEIWYITLPYMKPQMLFASVMAIVNAFKSGKIGEQLSGQTPTPQYAGHMLANHIEDYGMVRFEMGYAAAVSLFLLMMIYLFNRLSWRLFGNKEE